ncbi:MAG: hypothetical protein U5R06_17805 [candidate division KSB1 bacterium]|nr:hypothetical protein [candidate division KSB1 bacterium]
MESRKTLLNQIPPLNTIVTLTANFKQIMDPEHMDPTVARLLNLMDGKRTIRQVIDQISGPELTTLKHLAKLHQLGFLQYDPENEDESFELDSGSADNYYVNSTSAASRESTQLMPHEPVEEIDGNFEYSTNAPEKPEFASPGDILHEHERRQKRDTLLILSTDPDIQKLFLHHLEFKESSRNKTPDPHIRFGILQRKDRTLNILGVCMDRHFNAYMEFFGSSIHACLLLINREKVVTSYLNYLLTVLEKKLYVPITLVLKGDEKALYHDSRDLQQRVVNNENWRLLLKSSFNPRDIQDIIKSVSL